MSDWAVAVGTSVVTRRTGYVLFGLAVVLSFLPGAQVPVAALLAILAMHCFALSHYARRIADLQAALDMRDMAKTMIKAPKP